MNKKNASILGLKDDQYTDSLGNPVNPILTNRGRFRNARWLKVTEQIDTDKHLVITKLERKEFDQFGFFGYSIELSKSGQKWVTQVVKPDETKFLKFSQEDRIEKPKEDKQKPIMVCADCGNEFASIATHKHDDELAYNGKQVIVHFSSVEPTK